MGLFNRWLDAIADAQGAKPLGHPLGTGRGANIKYENSNLTRYCYGNNLHNYLVEYLTQWRTTYPNQHWSDLTQHTEWKLHMTPPPRIASPLAAQTLATALLRQACDFNAFHQQWELRLQPDEHCSLKSPGYLWNAAHWKKLPTQPWNWQAWSPDDWDTQVQQRHTDFCTNHHLNWDNEADRQILKCTGYPAMPILLATDGGHQTASHQRQSRTTAAMILFAATDLTQPDAWTETNITPVLIRIAILPPSIGSQDADNDHAELYAINMADETLPHDAICKTATDSTSAQSKFLALRDRNYDSHRQKVRHLLGGISKTLTQQLETNISLWTDHSPRPTARAIATRRLLHTLDDLKTQINDHKNAPNPWRSEYHDTHTQSALLKIDSHQLTPMGAPIP